MKKKCDSPLFNWNERKWDGLNFPPDLPFKPHSNQEKHEIKNDIESKIMKLSILWFTFTPKMLFQHSKVKKKKKKGKQKMLNHGS